MSFVQLHRDESQKSRHTKSTVLGLLFYSRRILQSNKLWGLEHGCLRLCSPHSTQQMSPIGLWIHFPLSLWGHLNRSCNSSRIASILHGNSSLVILFQGYSCNQLRQAWIFLTLPFFFLLLPLTLWDENYWNHTWKDFGKFHGNKLHHYKFHSFSLTAVWVTLLQQCYEREDL